VPRQKIPQQFSLRVNRVNQTIVRLPDQKSLSNVPRIHTGCATLLIAFARVHFPGDVGQHEAGSIPEKSLQSPQHQLTLAISDERSP